MNDASGIDQYVDRVIAGPGGAITHDAGAVTGDLTIATILLLPERRTARVLIQYTGAQEWYTLTGSPAPIPPGGLAAYHRDLLGRIRRGGAAQAS